MAGDFAKIFRSIWSPDSDFRERTGEEQRLYFLICSQREMNNAGMVPYLPAKWARCAADTTLADVERALAGLIEHRFVLVDEDTQELWVRSYMRRDEVFKHPYMRVNAIRAVETIESPKLRKAAAVELVRIGHPEGVAAAARLDPDLFTDTRPDELSTTRPDGPQTTHLNGSKTTVRDAIGMPSGTHPEPLSGDPSGTLVEDPSRSRRDAPGVGVGVVEGVGSSSVGGLVGGGRARERVRHPTAPTPHKINPENPRCKDHQHVPAGERGPNCHACRKARQAAEATTQPVDPLAAERAAFRAAVDACPDCDEHGMRELADGRSMRCDHEPVMTT